MRCLGITKKTRRCKNNTSFVFCKHHKFQGRLILFSLGASLIFISDLFDALGLNKPIEYVAEYFDKGNESLYSEVILFDNFSKEEWTSKKGIIKNIDTAYLEKQLGSNGLTLHTLRGDVFVKKDGKEEPIIKNLFLKELNFHTGEVTLKIRDFYPQMRHQQVGLILFDSINSISSFARLTAMYSFHLNRENQIVHQNDIQTILSDFPSEPKGNNKTIAKEFIVEDLVAFEKVWLKIEIEEDRLLFYYKNDVEIGIWKHIETHPIRFKPMYVGIAAFHGISKMESHEEYLNADTIPVNIEYLKITEFPLN